MDYSLFKIINGLTGNSVADSVFALLAADLPALLVLIVALVFMWRWPQRRHERRSGAVLGTVAAALSLLISQPIAHAIERARPYVAHPAHAHLLISRSHDFSFPSDHAVGAFALASGIWLYDRALGTALFVIAAALAFSRVYVGTHYPGDVMAGAVIGTGASMALFLAPVTRRLVEVLAPQAGRIWDGVLTLVPKRVGTDS